MLKIEIPDNWGTPASLTNLAKFLDILDLKECDIVVINMLINEIVNYCEGMKEQAYGEDV